MNVLRDPDDVKRYAAEEASATDKLRTLLRKIENIAVRALGTQPYDEVPCWEHLSSAVGEIEKELALVSAGNPPAESADGAETVKPCETPLDQNAPEMVRGEKPDEKKAIGNFAGVGKVVSYAIGRDMTVTVTARTAGEGEWVFEGIKDGETEIKGTILGGKWKAMQYCKFIRNGIVSRANRLYHAHHKAKKAAAALAGARSDAAGNQPTTSH